MNLVQKENTKLKDPHAHKARSFTRNNAVIVPSPASDANTTHSTSHANENANAFLKYTNNFLMSSILSLQTDQGLKRSGVTARDHDDLIVLERCEYIARDFRLKAFNPVEIDDD